MTNHERTSHPTEANRADDAGPGYTLVPIIIELRDRLATADGVLVYADFDGTLAPIVDHPEAAAPLPGVPDALVALRDGAGTETAVVSGRALADLRSRVGVSGIGYAGNHGLELAYEGDEEVLPAAAAAVDAIEATSRSLEEALESVDGSLVEQKGVTATIHYRNVEDEMVQTVKDAVHRIVGEQSAELRISPGKEILEVKPDVDWGKGAAVEWLAERMAPEDETWPIVYLGDDTTDENAFERIEDGVTIKVGTEEDTAAAYRVRDPYQVRGLLEWLVGLGSELVRAEEDSAAGDD